jgi:hypothetical protein
METYADDDQADGAMPPAPSPPALITHVAIQKMTHHERQALAPALADVRSRPLGPARLLGDSHYGSTESGTQCQSEGSALGAPAMPPKGSKPGQRTLENFVLDEVGRIVAWPQGHAPVWTSVSETHLAVRCAPVLCQACPNMHQCPGSVSAQPTKDGPWQYTHARVAPCHRRRAAQEPAGKAQ